MDRIDLEGIGMTSERTRLRLVARLREQGIVDERLLERIAATPRHLFVDEALAQRAYEDSALPIGFNQTLTQPYVCARMVSALLLDTNAAGGKPLERVLEVGTGSGYQTALLAQLIEKVYTVERIKPLQERARERLRSLGLRNVQYRHGDGLIGWPERAPYDAIIVSASPREVPPELLAQLGPGGRMVIPIGDDTTQELQIITREGEEYSVSVLGSVRFVPMVAGKVD